MVVVSVGHADIRPADRMKQLTPEMIEDWVAKHFDDYKKKSGGTQICINNPFDGDTGYHFWISLRRTESRRNKRTDYWVHDFRPGHNKWDGSFVNFVRQYKNISYFEALRSITGTVGSASKLLRELREGRQEESEEQSEPEESEIELPDNCYPLWRDAGSKAAKIAKRYLRSRKITEDDIERYKLHYTPVSIVFPYYEYGIFCYWQQRDVLGKRFSFPNEVETGLKKTDYLYGFDDVEPHDFVIMVEAIIDKISIGSDCVASGGATVIGKQISKLYALAPSTVVLAPDADLAGLKSLRSNYDKLNPKFKLAYCFPPKVNQLQVNDWNKLDQLLGKGTSRRYILDNSRKLTKAALVNPYIGSLDA